MSAADDYWALADQWLAEASDPSSDIAQAEYARDRYAEAVRNAKDAEAAEAAAEVLR